MAHFNSKGFDLRVWMSFHDGYEINSSPDNSPDMTLCISSTCQHNVDQNFNTKDGLQSI